MAQFWPPESENGYGEIFVLTSPRFEHRTKPGSYVDAELPCSFYVFKLPTLTIVKPSPRHVTTKRAYNCLRSYDPALKQLDDLFTGRKEDFMDPQQDGSYAEDINFFEQQSVCPGWKGRRVGGGVDRYAQCSKIEA
ncbi:MAG: hypothetical protein Q9183_006061 [Haloplaca sp. 2 TL-2023]